MHQPNISQFAFFKHKKRRFPEIGHRTLKVENLKIAYHTVSEKHWNTAVTEFRFMKRRDFRFEICLLKGKEALLLKCCQL